jgi:ribosomal protein S27E
MGSTRLQIIADAAGVDVRWLNSWLRDQIERRQSGIANAGSAGATGEPSRRCQSCGAVIHEKRGGRGRPRKFCTVCIPSGNPATVAKAWRRVNVRRTGGKPEARPSG